MRIAEDKCTYYGGGRSPLPALVRSRAKPDVRGSFCYRLDRQLGAASKRTKSVFAPILVSDHAALDAAQMGEPGQAPFQAYGAERGKALEGAGVTLLDGPFLDFRDPWGNRVEIVGYDNIQFTKAPNVLRGMGLMHLAKNEKAKKELADKGMALE
jgi:hypothetical protein